MVSSGYCENCQQPVVVEEDHAGGCAVCTRCGAVLEENAIAFEVTFTEQNGGSAVADGVFLSAGATRAKNRSKYGTVRGSGTESREQTLQNGYRRINQIGHAINMTERHLEAAQRYWNLCVVNGFNKGRKTNFVVACCLYVVCRIEKTSHMLIDFADLLGTNVYLLGATFLRLIDILKLDLPMVDPALYIARFAAKLEFGDKTQAVIRDALRLVQRMSRDWIQTGRRPAGICGACLFIAARMHNFERTYREIIRVVKICDATLKKRLEEFKNTPTADLSVSDFKSVWLEETIDPPSFKRSEEVKEKKKRKKKSKKGKKKNDTEPQESEVELETEETQQDSGVVLEEATRRTKRLKKTTKMTVDEEDEEEGVVLSQRSLRPRRHHISDSDEETDTHTEKQNTSAPSKQGLPKKRARSEAESDSEQDESSDSDSSVDEHDIFRDDELSPLVDMNEDEDAIEMQKFLSSSEAQTEIRKLAQQQGDNDDLSWLDKDIEISSFMLTEEEREIKAEIWTKENQDWEEKQVLKKLEKEKKEKEREKSGKKPRAPRAKTEPQHYASAAEATKSMLDTKFKRLSSRVNYEALKGLLGDDEDNA